MEWPERSLFGGAITCRLPPEWYDVSDLRQVPDHQECFCCNDNNITHMWVMEILQRNEAVDDDRIAPYLFHDLALANDAASTAPSFQPHVPTMPQSDGIVRRSGSGIQRIRPGRGAPEDTVSIQLAVWRLPLQYHTDVLFTLSSPLLVPHRIDGMYVERQRQAQHELFQQILSTIQIRDYALFQEG